MLPLLAVWMAGALHAQTLTVLGTTAPTPGTNDISQLSAQGNTTWPDTLNYFTDNQTGHGSGEPGQTFTTGTNTTGYVLTSAAFRTGGIGTSSGTSTSQPYYLHIYSVAGSSATLVQTYVSGNISFNDGDWLKWTGLSVRLAANATYAYSFGKASSTAGWEPMAVATNKYAGGQIALIPTVGGTITTGGSQTYDAVFDLGLELAPTNPPVSTPLPVPTYGFNLGNSLEAVWGFTYPTAAALNTAAAAGFNAVRIPVAWNHNATTNISGGVTNYPIDPVFMAKVKQTVDYAIAAGMYVVVNDHWDDGWMENNIGSTVDPVINAKMQSYWSQIATTFAGYDNHLLFAGANEPNVHNPDEMKTLMFYYQTFVNAVRGAGGNNTNRWLVIQAGGDTMWLNALPTDTVANRLMVEYHNYTPSLFTIIHSDQSWGNAIYYWGSAYHYSGDPTRNATWGEEGDIDSGFQQLADQYVSKGIPVMIGEFGAGGSGLTGTAAAYNNASVHYWNKYVGDSARAHGLSPFYWSTPGNPINFTSGAINDQVNLTGLTGGAVPPPPNGAPYAVSNFTATASNTNVDLAWTSVSGATSYSLYRAAESGYEGTTPAVTNITGTTYTDTNLNAGTTYYYHVVAVSNSLSSGFSPEAYATTSGVNPDPALYNFETDAQGWTGGGGIISGVAVSTTRHYAGRQSLAVNFNGASSGSSSVSVGNVVISPGQTITFHVWIPSGHKISNIQLIAEDHNYGWSTAWYGSFTPNAWNTLTLTLSSTALPTFHFLRLSFTTSAGWTDTCYIDSVSRSDVPPDFNMVANPTSLTVNGGASGSSTITVTPTYNLNACYTLSASNLPPGVSAAFTNNPITGGASVLTLTASNSAVSIATNVTVIATAGLISHTKTIALTVNGVAQPNTPPVLAVINNQTVNVGQNVAFTASATDTDQPPQTLTFSLLAGSGTATLNASNGAFSWTPQPGDAGTTNLFTIKVADNGTPSMSDTQSFYVTVNKQTPVLTAPVASVIAYGQALASSSLIGGAATNSANNASVAGSFAFTTPGTVPGVGTAGQSVTFTPTDTAHYNSATINVSVTVNKQTPVLTAPVASAIAYGQTLADSSLSGGAATNSANNASVAGSFAFTTPGTAPAVGTAGQSVTFTPTDTAHYNPATINVSVTVEQSSPTLAFSSSKNPSGYTEKVVFTVNLPLDATGNVNFLTNGVLFEAQTLSGGSATATNSALPNGTNLITAIYSGDSNYTGRTNAINQIVINTPPVLAAISHYTVNVGQTVAFTTSATDTDQPPQTLTFALLSGPANAALNTNSGAFSFRPLVTQADSTNQFTLQVSDSGSPGLSATQSFSVIVNPLSAPGISNISVAGGQFGFNVNGQTGPDYAIETSTNLTDWSNVFITNSPAVPFVWTDTNSAAPQRFYRVKLGPPLP